MFANERAAEEARRQVLLVAEITANRVVNIIESSLAPTLSLGIVIAQDPSLAHLDNHFDDISRDLRGKLYPANGTNVIQVAPAGIIRYIQPQTEMSMTAMNLNISDSICTDGKRYPSVYGPDNLSEFTDRNVYALFAQYEIWVPDVDRNETFGLGKDILLEEPGCYDPSSRSKFWGAVSSIIYMDYVISILHGELAEGYAFELAMNHSGTRQVLADSGHLTHNPITLSITAVNVTLSLSVDKGEGYDQKWKTPLIAVSVIVPFLVAILIHLTLVTHRRHEALLFALVPRQVVQGMDFAQAMDLMNSTNRLQQGLMLGQGTPAEHLLNILGDIIEGRQPDMHEVLAARAALHEVSANIHQPTLEVLKQRLGSTYGVDVALGLLRELQGVDFAVGTRSATLPSLYSAHWDAATGLGSDPDRLSQPGNADHHQHQHQLHSAWDDPNLGLEQSLKMLLQVAPSRPPTPADATSAGHAFTLEGSASGSHAGSQMASPLGPGWNRGPLGAGGAGGAAAGACASSSRRESSSLRPVASWQPGLMAAGAAGGEAPSRRASMLSQQSGTSPQPVPSPTKPPVATIATASSSGSGPGVMSKLISNLSKAVHRRSSSASGAPKHAVSAEDVGAVLDEAEDDCNPSPAAASLAAVALQDSSSNHSSSQLQQGTRQAATKSDPTSAPDLRGQGPLAQQVQALGSAEQGGAAMARGVMGSTHSSQLPLWSQPSPEPPLFDEVQRLLGEGYDSWTFDAFALDKASRGRPLSTLSFYLLHRSGLMQTFQMKPRQVALFLTKLEAGYRNNPYHNRTHAADVLQTMHAILTRGGLISSQYCDPLSHLGCILAAAAHDYEHGGLTNDYLVSTHDDLAVLYNDRSPQESHHSARLWALLKCKEYDILTGISAADRDRLRKLVIALILGTDMKLHFTTISQFATLHRIADIKPAMQEAHTTVLIEKSRSRGAMNLLAEQAVKPPADDAERTLSLQIALKAADIGHCAESLPVHLAWVEALEAEFFAQGDREKAAGLPVSPLMDRDKPGVSKSQAGFYDFVAIPLFHNFSQVFPGATPLRDLLLDCYRYWRSKQSPAATP